MKILSHFMRISVACVCACAYLARCNSKSGRFYWYFKVLWETNMCRLSTCKHRIFNQLILFKRLIKFCVWDSHWIVGRKQLVFCWKLINHSFFFFVALVQDRHLLKSQSVIFTFSHNNRFAMLNSCAFLRRYKINVSTRVAHQLNKFHLNFSTSFRL